MQCLEDFYDTVMEVLKQGQEISEITLRRKLQLMKELLVTGISSQTKDALQGDLESSLHAIDASIS